MIIHLQQQDLLLGQLQIIYFDHLFMVGLPGGVVFSTGASQREGSRFNTRLGPFCVEFACSPSVCVGSLRVLWLPPTVQRHAC